MPSFSFLRSSRGGVEAATPVHDHEAAAADHAEKVQRRKSKREYFRSLLNRNSLATPSKSDRWKDQTSRKPRPRTIQTPAEAPTSPMNKPLPLLPPSNGVEHTADRPVQLRRIIKPIALPELQSLFSGAPQFFCRSEGHHTGAPHPSVAFPWDEDVSVRDLSDHIRIQDEAWGSATALPHLTAQSIKNVGAAKERHAKQRAHFSPRCYERPNMLSMQGLERGTSGFQAALEMGVADAMELPDEMSSDIISSHRVEFLRGKDGLRPISDSILIDRLIHVGEVYKVDALQRNKSTIELYTSLFTQLLFPPSRVIDPDDPYSLEVQVDALVQVLAAPTVWVDFSLVEWRIRLGQILWGLPTDQDNEEASTRSNGVDQEPGTQRYWLLLQVLLACELVMRLDSISQNIEQGTELLLPAETRRFEKDATPSVKWSMLLARTWLENIEVQKPSIEELSETKPAGWLSTLTMGTVGTEVKTNDLLENVKFHGRFPAQQLSGLLHFARRLQWPNVDALEAKAAANGIKISDVLAGSVAATPMSVATNRSSSYFATRKPALRRGFSSQRNISAIIQPGGWLSNSYISGLILPGEGLSHFLMSTLLENDADAVPRLGEQANLYGGFIYCNRSFWSTACIVGRVLAAKASATECMGWVSSDVVPRGAGEGWADIDVEFPSVPPNKKSKARIYSKTAIETDSHIINNSDASSVLPGDFVLPPDDFVQPPLSIKFEGLDLFSAVDEVDESHSAGEGLATPMTATSDGELDGIKTYEAVIRFTVDAGTKEKRELTLNLNHDVHYVTAHPCIVSSGMEVLIEPGSEASVVATGHPLHTAFSYTLLPLSTLLRTPSSTPYATLLSTTSPSSPSLSRLSSYSTPQQAPVPKVLVIDCTTHDMRDAARVHGVKRGEFGSDMEMLIRAMCAERGWNALVSRRGRGCLSCAVREVGALGWGGTGGSGQLGVVVRIA